VSERRLPPPGSLLAWDEDDGEKHAEEWVLTGGHTARDVAEDLAEQIGIGEVDVDLVRVHTLDHEGLERVFVVTKHHTITWLADPVEPP
jgi:hypothetical protein